MQKSIIVTVTESGEVTVEGKNFAGKSCDAHMKAIEEAIGVSAGRTNLPEYNQKGSVQQKIG